MLIGRGKNRAFKGLGKTVGTVSLGSGGHRPEAAQKGDGHARNGGAPEGPSPQGPRVERHHAGQPRHDALLKGIRHMVLQRFLAGCFDQFGLQIARFHNSYFYRRHSCADGYMYFALVIFASIFRISARARKARTLTRGTDQPVIAAISLTGRSSISSKVMTSRAEGERRVRMRWINCRPASACSSAAPVSATNLSSQSVSGWESSVKGISRLRWWARRKS